MTVPFRATLEPGGSAAYLRVVPDGAGRAWRGALFQVDARGEPVEFTFSHLDLPASVLWRPQDLRRRAVASLVTGLFEAARRTPLVVLCRADEVEPAVFDEMIEVQLPVCRAAPAGAEPEAGPGEVPQDLLAGMELVRLLWRPAVPNPASPQRRLLDSLNGRGLLLEPFDRTLAGLEEALAAG
ncbi:MAG TPA: hypothetical protein VFD01_21210 [Candidatus Dormibacteraeota bacterium]|nr:hypothetical protein [Candidatus Dormibacteraeota bacterium]